jgi:hypothetical protein
MKKFLVLTIFFFTFSFIYGQTYSTVTSDKEIYDFLNWLTANNRKFREEPKLKRKQIFNTILPWDTASFIMKDTARINKYPEFNLDYMYLYNRKSGTDTIFKQLDRDFLYKQLKAVKDTIWHEKFFKSLLLTDLEEKSLNGRYYSVPLFSIDKKYVVIQRVYVCGNECAYGGYFVYKRIKNKKWVYVTTAKAWMS